MRQLKPLLPTLADCSYETLAKFGIDDLYFESNTGEYALYPSAENYVPEPL